MKKLFLYIFITCLILGFVVTYSSCNRYCDPANIRSGKSLQHHDTKQFKAQIRIMWSRQYGNFCKVRYANMKTIENRIYENCDCSKFIEGTWVSLDSI